MNDTPHQTNPYSTPAVTSQVVKSESIVLGQYSTVRRGFQFIYYSVAVIAAMLVLTLVVSALTGAMSPRASSSIPSSIAIGALALLALSLLAAGLLMLVGFCMCAACPNPNEKPKVLISIISFFIAMILGFASGVLEDFQPFPAMICDWSGNLLNVVSTVAFCLFVMQVGTNISSDDLRKSSKSALTWYGLLILAALVLGVAAVVIASSGSQVADSSFMIFVPLAGILLVLSLGTFFKFLSMIRVGIVELKPPQ